MYKYLYISLSFQIFQFKKLHFKHGQFEMRIYGQEIQSCHINTDTRGMCVFVIVYMIHNIILKFFNWLIHCKTIYGIIKTNETKNELINVNLLHIMYS